MNMDFGANKIPVKELEKAHLEGLILDTFILVLMVNGIESHGNNFIALWL